MARVVIRGSFRLALIPLLPFGVVAASAPMPNSYIEATWLAAVCFSFGWLGRRVWLAAVEAGPGGIVVRNIGRTYVVPWGEVEAVTVERSDNVTGAVTCLVVHRRDGTGVVARATSAYARRKVEGWRDVVAAQRPSS